MPRQYEGRLFETLTSLARVGIVLSWSNHRGGRGHVNCRPLRYVVEQLTRRGFFPDRAAAQQLARSATVAYWIGSSVMVYRRNASHRHTQPTTGTAGAARSVVAGCR